MKKYLALLLALTISAGLFTSCGSKNDTTSSKTTNNTSTVEKTDDKIENALTGEAKKEKLKELNDVAGEEICAGTMIAINDLDRSDRLKLEKLSEPIDITITGEDAVKLAEQENRFKNSKGSTFGEKHDYDKISTEGLDLSKQDDAVKYFKCAIGEVVRYSDKDIKNYTFRVKLQYDPSEMYDDDNNFHVMALCSEPNVALIGAYEYTYNSEEFHKKTAEITDINSKEADEIFTWGEDNK